MEPGKPGINTKVYEDNRWHILEVELENCPYHLFQIIHSATDRQAMCFCSYEQAIEWLSSDAALAGHYHLTTDANAVIQAHPLPPPQQETPTESPDVNHPPGAVSRQRPLDTNRSPYKYWLGYARGLYYNERYGATGRNEMPSSIRGQVYRDKITFRLPNNKEITYTYDYDKTMALPKGCRVPVDCQRRFTLEDLLFNTHQENHGHKNTATFGARLQ